jgi:prophage regulatory protein
MPTTPERFVRRPEVSRLTGMARSTVYVRISQGLFPEPISIGPRMVAWRESEIAAINAAHIRGANDDEIRDLVSQLVAQRKGAA